MPESHPDPSTGQPGSAAQPASAPAKAASSASPKPAPTAKASAKSAGPAASAGAPRAQGDPNDPIALLKADHRKVEGLFEAYDKASDPQKSGLARQICAELVIHTLIEEEIFYPACRSAAVQDGKAEDALDEAQVEHDSAKLLIADLWDGAEGDEFRDAKVKVLGEMIRHHIREEEKPQEGVFAKAQEQGVGNPDVARRLRQRKQALLADQERGRLQPGAPVSFSHQPRPSGRFIQENDMPRNYGPERDERGRFTSDDDDRGGRSYGARSQGGRYYARDDDDDRGGRGRGQGGWFGDSEGHSRASREGWEDRRGESRSYGRGREDDDRSYGRSRDDDYDDRRGGRGQGGWFGDSEGHSRAAREGWDNPDHGRSGWYGDSRGHAEASRRGWENSDHGRSGWYGDPEGHSEASRRGWDERRDDNRGYRSRGRDEDDDRRSGRGGGGQGGWFGDPQGHSESSRRGWQDRR
jgi:hypothetical protein